jgi:hypothetical protein
MPLGDQLDSDLAAFFDTATGFAVSATLSKGGVQSTVAVILDTPFALSEVFESAANSNYAAHGKRSDFSGAVRGDTLTVNGTTYHITSEPRDTGDNRVIKVLLSTDALS